MCGISGFVGPSWQPHQLHAMAEAQKHRGPDDIGFCWKDGDDFPEMGQCGLASNRLAIIDPTPAGNMPMFGGTNGNWLVIVANCEIYNYRELRAELSGYPFRTRTDTEVILAAYEQWGADCVKRFNGMFAFAIWDGVKQELFCARDRLGQKPFYMALVDGDFTFASEIKGILASGYPAYPDELSVWAYLNDGLLDHQDATWFQGIWSLKPGWSMVVRPPDVESQHYTRYWELPNYEEPLNDEQARTQFMDLLIDSVRLRLRSDVPLALNYSGGLDSSALHKCMGKVGSVHEEEMVLTKDWEHRTWPLIEEAVRALEHPLGSLETLAYYKMLKMTSGDGYKVVLDGNGADEILAGYPWHDASKALRSQLERDLLITKLPRVLRMNDRLSMAHGVELRSPFLDYRLVEFCFTLPDRFKIRDGHRKWLLRYAVEDWRPKVQQTDTLALLTGPLQTQVEEIIHAPEFAMRGLWDAAAVQSEFKALCLVEAGQQHDRIPSLTWRYISTELWFRTFVDGG